MKEPIDIAERKRVIDCISRNIAIEAGAGTGKTSVLIERYLTLIKNGIPIENIASITFTVKAAREMAWRIREKLENELAKSEINEKERRYILRALLNFNKANIQTIHSLALDILRERPFEAGIDPGLKIGTIDWDDQIDIFKKWLLSLNDSEKNLLVSSIKLNVKTENLVSIATQLMNSKDILLGLKETEEDEPEIVSNIIKRFKDLERVINDMFMGSTDDLLYKEFLKIKNDIEPIKKTYDIFSNNLYPDNYRTDRGQQDNWVNKERAREEINKFILYKDSQVERYIYWLSLKILYLLKKYIIMTYQLKIEKSTFEFDDILLEARNLLRENNSVRQYIKQKYKYLLIDEFQDTDPLQVEMAYLICSEVNETNWQKTKLKDGSIFIVGDPKQSIYHFRRADLSIYRLAEDIITRKGDKIELTQNFRSNKGIIDWVNNSFKDIIGTLGNETIDPKYTDIKPYHTDLSYIANSPINFIFPKTTDEIKNVEDARQFEARYISATIEKIINEGWKIRDKDGFRETTYRDIAILYFKNTDNEVYEGALNSHNIRYSFIKPSDILQQNPEIEFIKYILSAIQNPYDEFAIICSLKSPFFAISDEEITEYCLKYGKISILERPKGNGHISKALKILNELHCEYKDKHLYEIISEIIKKTNILLRAPLINRDRFLKSIFDLLETTALEKSDEPTFTIRDFSNNITYLLEGDEKKTINIFDPNEDAVKLMTIFQSKGLEFPIVFLAKLGSGEQCGTESIIKDFVNRKLAISFSKILKNECYDELKEKEKIIDNAEKRRLLYVACTRAKDYLFIPLFSPNNNSNYGYYKYFNNKLPSVSEIYNNNLPGKVINDYYYLDPYQLNLDKKESFIDVKKILTKQSSLKDYMKEREEKINEREILINSLKSEIPKIKSITEIAGISEQPEARKPIYKTSDMGVHIGGRVHEVMELINLDGSNIREIVDLICDYEDESLKERVKESVRKLINLPLIKRAVEIGRYYREVPVSYKFGDEIRTGKIDILIVENDGLVISDYKTDSVDEEEWKGRLEKYKTQLNLYKEAIEISTKKKVKGIYILNPIYGEIKIEI
ncbi:MAG: UvrD-helicase domain-containing protein [bacterium]